MGNIHALKSLNRPLPNGCFPEAPLVRDATCVTGVVNALTMLSSLSEGINDHSDRVMSSSLKWMQLFNQLSDCPCQLCSTTYDTVTLNLRSLCVDVDIIKLLYVTEDF